MRAVIQRVTSASVQVNGQVVGSIDPASSLPADVDDPARRQGLLVLVGVAHDDDDSTARKLASKIWGLRILADEKSASDIGAPILVVSQFTLYADTRKGRRPSWGAAAPGPVSEPLLEAFAAALRDVGARVETGVFGADMKVSLVNDGPVTLIIDM
ncbi:D-aminoacyl-tRNA deacylase [Phytoactinopolyspora limicola]|uniref:D-aminoacyl-tRNA deacylase n=1 Tax=Phytoactinopolyspora limicola TaxID=2715536 RepID=UPI00140E005B|nr:D-aminoacyl-tRNA deacylase [Phytoactinopolyspora limicola]